MTMWLVRNSALTASWWLLLALVTSLLACPAAAQAGDDDDSGPLNLTPSKLATQTCTTTDTKRDGVCVKYTQCLDNRTIDVWGTVDDNEIRIGGCSGQLSWCCEMGGVYSGGSELTTPPPSPSPTTTVTLPEATPPGPEVTTSEPTSQPPPLPMLPPTLCSKAAEGECPWCVTLHRNGGAPWTRKPDGRYCAGTLVGGGNAVLTAASCVRAATRQTLWLQHAGAAHNYTVHSAATHPQYNSGSREHDLALVVLSQRVSGAVEGACLALDAQPTGACRAFAPATPDTPWSQSAVRVSGGLCKSGGADGALCARAEDAASCRVLLGAPLLCGGEVAGVSRGGGCESGATYSSVATDAHWLRSLLPEATTV